jgi:hypothetical protein
MLPVCTNVHAPVLESVFFPVVVVDPVLDAFTVTVPVVADTVRQFVVPQTIPISAKTSEVEAVKVIPPDEITNPPPAAPLPNAAVVICPVAPKFTLMFIVTVYPFAEHTSPLPGVTNEPLPS